MTTDAMTNFLRRCFDLARLGAGRVSPNPMVGAVLAHEGRIIGEGWHQRWGEAHAEVNCLRSVSPDHQSLIAQSTLYCSLEPCFHFGKTPPCVDLILEKKIPRVVVSNTDPNPKVAGQSIAKLRAAGVEVITGVLESEGRWLNRAFFTWIMERRPYVVLKWAQSSDGYLARRGERTAVSGPAALRLVHRWRGECDAVLVGTTTALTDNPRLDTRFFPGKNPLRVALDLRGKIPASHHLLDGSAETWVYGPHPGSPLPGDLDESRKRASGTPAVYKPVEGKVQITNLLQDLAADNRAILLVEGGADVLRQFLDSGLWDEIRVLENAALRLGDGVAAPAVPGGAFLAKKWAVGEEDVARVWVVSSPPPNLPRQS
jgi:diaminohydroxyphosphoribosylaminopyrimidine deaminase / 5-amino-6-(5-phosphoribosylamino)uracil reductase